MEVVDGGAGCLVVGGGVWVAVGGGWLVVEVCLGDFWWVFG